MSVIVPVYNVERYLKQCLDSILNQSYTDLEIILVDDGSTDQSGDICDEYAKKDSRIKVIHKLNGGLISARLAGLFSASSPYVTFVDSDDWISSSMYECLMDKMIQYDVDMVTSGCIRYQDELHQLRYFDKEIECGLYEKKDIETQIIPIMLWNSKLDGWALDPSLCMKIFKTDLLLKQYRRIEKENFYYGEDTAIIYPYILEINSMYCTRETFYYHRQKERGSVPGYLTEDGFFNKMLVLYHALYESFKKSECREILIKQLDFFYIRSVQYHSQKYQMTYGKKRTYLFPFQMVPAKSKIILYGAGDIGIQYFMQIKQLGYCNVVSWMDKKITRIKGYTVESPDQIGNKSFDYIVIAILNKQIKEEIKKKLVERGIEEEKIITCVPEGYFSY
ncbi:putative glycosyltransferase [Lachnospiraceae bacterium KM106-2]|nr:putative glycosyltransferase [Lachnospiraceae bacterium KM106-2]